MGKTLTEKLGAKMVGAVILICSFFITLLGINGYIMVFVLYPIADNLLKQNKMDRRVLRQRLCFLPGCLQCASKQLSGHITGLFPGSVFPVYSHCGHQLFCIFQLCAEAEQKKTQCGRTAGHVSGK